MTKKEALKTINDNGAVILGRVYYICVTKDKQFPYFVLFSSEYFSDRQYKFAKLSNENLPVYAFQVTEIIKSKNKSDIAYKGEFRYEEN